MAGKIRGITIEIGGDTSGLEKSLKKVNGDIKDTQNQLKDVERLLKLDPTNVELLEQKQRLLNGSVAEYENKLKTLKEEQQKFADAAINGVEGAQESYDALQREIVSTEDYLKRARKEADSFSVSTAKLSEGLKEAGNKAQVLSDKTKALSAAGAAVAGAFVAAGLKAAQAADDLNTLAQQSGFSTAELQKFQYAADRVDVSAETIIAAAKKLKKNMTSTSTDVVNAWSRLGIAVTNSNGELRDSTTVFYEVLEALSQVGNETERDTLAMQIFGRNADELAGIIDDGGAALRQYGAEAEAAGLIWSQESIDAANATQDLIDKLKADVSQTILITGAKALEALTPVIEKVSEKVSELLEWIASLDAETIEMILAIALIIAAVSPILGLIAQITLALSGLIALLPVLTAAAPWIALAVAIGTAVALIIAHWDEFKQFFVDMVASLKEKWENFKGFFVNMWDVLKSRAVENINSIVDALNNIIDKINNFTSTLNSFGLSKVLGLNIMQIPTLNHIGQTMTAPTASAGANYTTSNTTNVYNQTSTNPIQVNIDLDGKVLARGLYDPLNTLSTMKGSSAVR